MDRDLYECARCGADIPLMTLFCDECIEVMKEQSVVKPKMNLDDIGNGIAIPTTHGAVHAEQYKPVVISDASYSPTTMNPVEVQKHELEVQQTKALASLAEGVNAIAAFITGGGMSELLSGYARTQAVQSILGGLASHDGRNALDARVLGQNAVEIVEQIEKVFDKYHSRKTSEKRDPVIHTEDDRPREGETREEYGARMRAKKEAEDVD